MIAPWAADYVGIPYVAKGQDRSGLDCWSLVVLIYREVFGVVLPSFADEYEEVANRPHIAGLVDRRLPESWREVADINPGDGLLFRLAGWPMHVGVAVGDGRFLHVYSALTASCIERLASPLWARRFIGSYRYVG